MTNPVPQTPRLIRLDDAPVQAWKNGGGHTRELLAWPAASAWSVRVSVADVATGGPFSLYPGVRRWLALVAGPGLALRIDGDWRVLTAASPPLSFDGGDAVEARLDGGPTQDLNLMLRGARGSLHLSESGRGWSPRARFAGLFTAVGGVCMADDRRHAVPAHSLLWFDAAPHALAFIADAAHAGPAGWWVAATPDGDTA